MAKAKVVSGPNLVKVKNIATSSDQILNYLYGKCSLLHEIGLYIIQFI